MKKTDIIKRGSRRNGIESMKKRAFYMIMAPYLAFILAFKLFPFLWGIYMSFTNYTGFNLDSLSFVGLSNYTRVFTDVDAMSSIGRTFGIAFAVVPGSMTICLIMSLMLNTKLRGIGAARTICYLPSIIPAVAISIIWKGMYEKNGGFFNAILALFNVEAINWFDFNHVYGALILMMFWGAGAGVLTNIAAIKCIPESLYEAAEIEGAGFLRKTFRITLPLMSNMLYMNLLISIIGVLQMFAEPVLLTGEGGLTALPARPIYTYLVHVYQQIFVNMRFSYGLAMIWVIFIIIMLITIFAEYSSKKWVYSESD